MTKINYSTDAGVALIELNDPPANTYSYEMMQEIDAAIIHGIALRLPILGVFAKADFTGLQLMYDAARNRSGGAGEGGPGRVLAELVEAGRTGVLSGAGFYDWSSRSAAEWFEDRDRRLVELKRAMRRIGSLAGFQEKGEEEAP